MKKIRKILFNMLICLIVLLVQTGCFRTRFEYKDGDLIVLAENNLLGLYNLDHPSIVKIDKDEYGRVLFIYSDDSTIGLDKLQSSGEGIWAILIKQKTEDGNVYYYPNVNFIIKKRPIWTDEDRIYSDMHFLQKAYKNLSEDEINTLKEANDWGKPIDESKCVKSIIVDNERIYGGFYLVSKNSFEEVYHLMYPGVSLRFEFFFNYLTSDQYNRHIFYFRTIDENRYYKDSYVVMFFPDGTYDIAQVNDVWNYQEELKEFKERNNWNEP